MDNELSLSLPYPSATLFIHKVGREGGCSGVRSFVRSLLRSPGEITPGTPPLDCPGLIY